MSGSIVLNRALSIVPVALAAIVATSSCGAPPTRQEASAAGGFPLTISSCGRDVRFERAPDRVITVGSVAAPLIAAAGAADRVVTRTFETAPFPGEYGEALKNAEMVTVTADLAREQIIARSPDVVVSFEGAAVGPEDLATAGIPLLVTRGYCKNAAGTYEDIFADIDLYGRLFGTEKQAAATLTALRGRVAAIADAHRPGGPARPAAALILSRDGATLSAYGSTSTVHTQMGMLGLANVFGDVAKRSFEANTETLIARDPDVLIVLTQGEQTPDSVRTALRDRPELASLSAIRNDRVIAVPFGYTGPGPVAVEGLEVLSAKLGALQ
ncbi:ABC transporter substrate-binding protein [Nocardia jejuensis]|uniref:ABC transporter substrate-binding protein n=1 Tax=Nocardia jejuensis TaxID=328049 RepID=UPI000833485E|nr:ABC transporter substrate-binding protein [Nocardia jejuensis]